jgi:hypothetical protein
MRTTPADAKVPAVAACRAAGGPSSRQSVSRADSPYRSHGEHGSDRVRRISDDTSAFARCAFANLSLAGPCIAGDVKRITYIRRRFVAAACFAIDANPMTDVNDTIAPKRKTFRPTPGSM